MPAVGGMRASSLLVKVREPATEGKANDAVLLAVADAFGVRPRAVRLVHGRGSRRKLVEVDIDDETGAATLARLKASPGG